MNIKYTIPFTSRLGAKYRVDIYDRDHTGRSTTLTAGETPFVIDEDNSDDFFAPVRTQTGTLQVCTQTATGNMLTIADLIPDRPLSRPVRLVRVTGSTETVVWQGYLSSDSYTQDFTGAPQVLDLSVNSMLEVAKYTTFYYHSEQRKNTVRDMLLSVCERLSEQYVEEGVSAFEHIYFSARSRALLEKIVQPNLFVSYDEVANEDMITHKVRRDTVYDVLEKFCTFAGLTVREVGKNLYFCRYSKDEYGYVDALEEGTEDRYGVVTRTIHTTPATSIESCSWGGDGHTISVHMPAGSVAVKAKMSKYELPFTFPTCPFTDMQERIGIAAYQYYDKCTKTVIDNFRSYYIAQAFFARYYRLADNQYSSLDLDSCLVLKKGSRGNRTPICRLSSHHEFFIPVPSGYDAIAWGMQYGYFMVKLTIPEWKNGHVSAFFYFAGYQQYITMYYDDKIGCYVAHVDIPTMLYQYYYGGDIHLDICDGFTAGDDGTLNITDIKITYEPPYFKGGRENISSNVYKKTLSGRDEVSVSLDIASNLYNADNAALLLEVVHKFQGPEEYIYTAPVTTITYYAKDGTGSPLRPEIDLLNRMAAYYSSIRQELSLEITNNLNHLPFVVFIGKDGTRYTPIAASIDYARDVRTLTCMELP